MGNGTTVSTTSAAQQRLASVLDAYRGLLRADERQLHDAMREYERSCWDERLKHAA